MKVLYFHQHFSTPKGSTGTRSYEFSRKLIERGHSVTVVCGSAALGKTGLTNEPIRGIRKGIVDGIRIIEISLPYSNYDSLMKRSLIFFKYSLKSIKIALKEDYDLLFATSTPLTAGIPGIIAKFLKPQKKFIFEVRDLWPELPKAMGVIKNPLILAGMSFLEKMSYWTMDGGIGLSPGIKKGIRKRAQKGKPIIMIPNGCDLELFNPADRRLKEKRGKIHEYDARIKPGDFVAVFTGAHGLANGLDAVLDAAQVVKKKKMNHIKFLFIGDGKLKPHLLQRSIKEELSNCIFLDPIPKKKLAELMREVDLGLMILDNISAFYYGTSPNKFFDYISMGLPILINYPGWLANVVYENDLGIAVPPCDPKTFAYELYGLSMEKTKLEKAGINARALAERLFDRNKLANQFVTYLESF